MSKAGTWRNPTEVASATWKHGRYLQWSRVGAGHIRFHPCDEHAGTELRVVTVHVKALHKKNLVSRGCHLYLTSFGFLVLVLDSGGPSRGGHLPNPERDFLETDAGVMGADAAT